MLEKELFQVLDYKLPNFIASKLRKIIPLDFWESAAFQVSYIAAGVDYIYITFFIQNYGSMLGIFTFQFFAVPWSLDLFVYGLIVLHFFDY